MKRWPIVIAALFGLATGASAQQQPYPNKPIRLVVPYAPGGGVDLVGRTIMTQLSARLGQPIVYENRGGAGATIGTHIATKAPPDGYTLLFSLNALTINAAITPKLPYDPLRDLAPISQMLNSASILVAHPSMKVRSVKELIAMAKARPGELNYGSQGPGTNAHMMMELMKKATGIDIVHVPYNGGGPASNALLAAEVQVMFLPSSFGSPIVKSGKVVPLAVTTGRRLPALANVPTLAEAGVPGAERGYSGYWGLFAPARTPRPIIDRIARDLVAIMHTAEMKELCDNRGLEPVGSSPDEFAAMLREDFARWKRLAQETGISVAAF